MGLLKSIFYILTALLVIGAIFSPAPSETSEKPINDEFYVRIACDSPWHGFIEIRENDTVIDEMEGDHKGSYSNTWTGSNLSVYVTAHKIDPTNIEDELEISILGHKLYKHQQTYYPGWDLELEATGAEDKALQEES